MSSLWDRMRERKLVQWTVAYLAAAWMLLQVADLLGEQFGWPVAVLRALTLALAGGLPLAIVVAWYHGEKGQQRVSGPELVIIATLLVIAGAAMTLVTGRRRAAAPLDHSSVAVLPFENLSADRENEYFSDGVTEDIITQLSKIGGLRVIGRTSVMAYKGKQIRLRAVGQELGVAHVLEGSVRRIGNRVRITAQLVNAATEGHLWAETFDRELKDVFAIQTEIATRIADALKAALSPAERERLAAAPTVNLTAYDYYLRGRDYYYEYLGEANENAIALFRRAIEVDPGYALAWAGLGDAFAQRALRFGMGAAWLDSAEAVARKAIALDAAAAEGHKALGLVYLVRGWSRKAIEANERALSLNPGYWAAMGNLGYAQMQIGNMADAARASFRSVSIEPTLAESQLTPATLYLMLEDDGRAEPWLRRALELQPNHPGARNLLIELYLLRGDLEAAAAAAQGATAGSGLDPVNRAAAAKVEVYAGRYDRAVTLFEGVPSSALVLRDQNFGRGNVADYALALMRSGRAAEARRLIDKRMTDVQREREQGAESLVVPLELAALHALRGEKEHALRELERAARTGLVAQRMLARDPAFESLRGEPEFQGILAAMKTRAAAERRRIQALSQG
ncbi:MAG: tetratricopeptide repeat protein [Gemmatimonadetes bacterium]|nr:tetratricopeptide repeat protein [Gemmatimonadota bacterium]